MLACPCTLQDSPCIAFNDEQQCIAAQADSHLQVASCSMQQLCVRDTGDTWSDSDQGGQRLCTPSIIHGMTMICRQRHDLQAASQLTVFEMQLRLSTVKPRSPCMLQVLKLSRVLFLELSLTSSVSVYGSETQSSESCRLSPIPPYLRVL